MNVAQTKLRLHQHLDGRGAFGHKKNHTVGDVGFVVW